ncbi:uncharacterized protein METZ01_LOCUS516565, partial [marine metagenome]
RRPCRATGAGRRGAGLPRGPRQRRADPSRRALPPAPGRTDRESLAAGFRPWPGGTRLAGHRAEQGGGLYRRGLRRAARPARCPGGRRQRGGGCADGRLPARPVRPHALPAATHHRPARGIRHEGPSRGKTPEGL